MTQISHIGTSISTHLHPSIPMRDKGHEHKHEGHSDGSVRSAEAPQLCTGNPVSSASIYETVAGSNLVSLKQVHHRDWPMASVAQEGREMFMEWLLSVIKDRKNSQAQKGTVPVVV